MPELSDKVRPLDGVRGLAILAVMGFHFGYELMPGGAFGVDIFFVLSAFLITSLLLRERERTGRTDFAAFYYRRAFRLLPALLVFLVLIAPPIAMQIGTADSIPHNTWVVFVYMSDFARAGVLFAPLDEPYGHAWSLAIEEQFYLLWPAALVILAARFRRLIPVGALLWVVGVVATIATASVLGVGPDYFLPTGHLHSLAIGCIAAFIANAGAQRRLFRLGANPYVAGGALVLMAALVLLDRQSWPYWLALVAGLIGSAAAGVVTFHAGFSRRKLINAALSVSVLVWLGRRSYGIYLYHSALYHVFTPPLTGLSRTVNTVLAIVASLVIAELSFRLVERPVLKWGRRWRAGSTGAMPSESRAITSRGGVEPGPGDRS